jgi:hypothetical protein
MAPPPVPPQKEVLGSQPSCPNAGNDCNATITKTLARKAASAFFLLRRIAEIHLEWSFRKERSQELAFVRVNLQEKRVKR